MIRRFKYFRDSLNTVVILPRGGEFFSGKYVKFPLTFMRSN